MTDGDGFLSEDTQNRLSVLQARLSVTRGEKLSLDETVRVLLERDRKRVELQSWLYTAGIFALVTFVLLWPLYLIVPQVVPLIWLSGAVVAAVSTYLLTPIALKWHGFLVAEQVPAEIQGSVESMSRAAGLRYTPKVYVYDNEELNAMAFESIGGGGICLTRGIISAYERGRLALDELNAVIGHELGHLKHRDCLRFGLAMSWISIFQWFGALYTQIGVALLAAGQGDGEEKEGQGGCMMLLFSISSILVGLVIVLLAKLVSAFSLHLSRKQELEADDIGAELTHPRTMALALSRLESLNQEIVEKDRAQLPYADRWQLQPGTRSWAERLWDSHPLVESRVGRLQSLVPFMDQ